MAKELTVEAVAKVVAKEGIVAAKKYIADGISDLLERAAAKAIRLGEESAEAPAKRGRKAKASGERKRGPNLTAEEKAALDKKVSAATPHGKEKGVAISVIAKAAGEDANKVRQSLKRIGAKMAGDKKNAVWYQ